MTSEHKRKLVHISMVGFALCIGRLPPLAISFACLSALLFNLWILPRLTARELERADDLKRGFSLGMLAYPAILLLLSGVYWNAQIFLAIAWGAMSFGDGFAGLVGAGVRGPKLPWNPAKSWSGLLAFPLLGIPLTLGLLALLPAELRLGIDWETWTLAVSLGLIAAGLMETVPGLVDDNLVVPVVASAVAYVVMQLPQPSLPVTWPLGLGLVLLLTVLSMLSRKIDVPGGICGGVLAGCVFLGGGLTGLSLLFLFFVLGTAVSIWKVQEKSRRGLAQEKGGQRSVRHALANGGTAAICGLLAWLFPESALVWQTGLAASLAAAMSDTTASELGTVYGRTFVNILTWKTDLCGRDGVISREGTLLGLLASFLIALAYALGGATVFQLVLVTAAGFAGNLIDSVLGASLQRRGYMTNDTVNFANTAFAAGLATLLCNMFWG